MSSNVVRMAVIGCGRIAGHHCRRVSEVPGAKVVAVCDLVAEKAAALGLKPRARIIASTVTAIRPEVMGLGPVSAIQALLILGCYLLRPWCAPIPAKAGYLRG